MRTLLRSYTAWIRPDRFGPVFALALLVKGLFFLGLILRFRETAFPGYWGGFTFDSGTYIQPVEHLIASGSYDPDYRLPGFAAPYWLLRCVLSQAMALNAMISLQLLLDALSVVLLARVAWKVSGAYALFHAVFWVFGISTFVSLYDVLPLTESLTGSLVVIALYFGLRSMEVDRPALAAVVGLCCIWAAFLRPVMFPVLGIPLLTYLLWKGVSWRRRATHIAAFLIPALLVEGAWIIRNEHAHGRFIPLSTSWLMPHFLNTPTYRMCEVVQAFGGSLIWWDPHAEIRAFNVRDLAEPDWVLHPEDPPVIPAYAATSAFPMDSLRALATTVEQWQDAAPDDPRKQLLDARIMERGAAYIASFRSEHPFRYQVTARLRLLAKFTLHSGTYMDMPHPRNAIERIAKGFYSVVYVCCIVLGAAGAVVALFHRRWPRAALGVPLIFGYGLLVHPFVLRFTDYRYLVPFYALALLLGAWLVYTLISARRDRPAA